MSVDIGFCEDGKEDEVEFDLEQPYDEDELNTLFEEFCKENKIKVETIASVSVVDVAKTMDELL